MSDESLPTPRSIKPRWSLTAKLIIGAAAVVTLVFARFAICLALGLFVGQPSVQFDSVRWKRNWPCICTPVRAQMVNDLLAADPLQRMTKAEVTELLGSPDRNTKPEKYEKAGDFVYHLQRHPFFDDWWLVVRFDDSGLVREAEIILA